MKDVLRSHYKQLTNEQHSLIKDIKNQAYELMDLIAIAGQKYDIRSSNMARTKLEECVMWATKSVSWTPDNEE